MKLVRGIFAWCLVVVLLAFALPPPPAFAVSANEQEWIVDEVSRDVAEILLFAASKQKAAGVELDKIEFKTTQASPNIYDISLKWNDTDGKAAANIPLKEYVWNPENYAPIASQLAAKFELKPNVSDDSGESSKSIVEMLSNFTQENIAAENKRVADALNKSPLDAELHEQAALICAVQALREHAGSFSDTRPSLNRISAHLAIARALKGTTQFGTAGKIAEITLDSVGGRQLAALSLIDAMNKTKNEKHLDSWLRALKIRSTQDYRLAISGEAQRVERLEHARALVLSTNPQTLVEIIPRDKPEEAIEWLRIGLTKMGSVQTGHMLAEPAVAAEGSDYMRDRKIQMGSVGISAVDKSASDKSAGDKSAGDNIAVDPKTVDPKSVDPNTKQSVDPNVDLNLKPTRCLVKVNNTWQLNPISWADIGAFHCRHVFNAFVQKFIFEAELWSVPEMAKQTQKTSERLAGIDLYPLLEDSLVTETYNEKTQFRNHADKALTLRLVELLKKSPQLVTAELWRCANEFEDEPKITPAFDNWFNPNLPFGTAYNFELRKPDRLDVPELERLAKISPYSPKLYEWLAWRKFGTSATEEQLTSVLGEFSQYDVDAIKLINQANRRHPERYVVILEQLAKFEPSSYWEMGQVYVSLSQPEKAVAAFENALKKCPNAVENANNSGWLINYYFDHNQKDKASRLADEGAEVYSADGLQHRAMLYERMHNLSEAEKYYLEADERYDHKSDLAQFYLRNAEANPEWKAEGERRQKRVFPNGLQKIKPSDLTLPPKVGNKFYKMTTLMEEQKLKIGDIIVGVQGYKIDNNQQYQFIRRMDPVGTDIEIVVWDGNAYRTIKCKLADKSFQSLLATFTPDQKP